MNLIIIQSRNGSKRLPFKSVLSISGFPTLVHILKRLNKLNNGQNKIVVATSVNIEDDIIEDICQANNTYCFRGHPTNVLSRFKELAKTYDPEYIIRITGDCPLINPDIIDQLINKTKKLKFDYASNTIKRTFPHGFDAEIFKSTILKKIINPTAYDSEHVTPFIYNSNKYKLFSLLDKENHSAIRLTLDTKFDYFFINKLVRKIFLKTSNYFEVLNSEEINSIIISNNELLEIHKLAKSKSKFSY